MVEFSIGRQQCSAVVQDQPHAIQCGVCAMRSISLPCIGICIAELAMGLATWGFREKTTPLFVHSTNLSVSGQKADVCAVLNSLVAFPDNHTAG